jgi:hypothetical protein
LGVLCLFAVICAACVATARAQTSAEHPVSGNTITVIPATFDKACRRGRATLYDECSDQLALFATAMSRAAAENKVLLVSYGAEWCIWCHVFTKYIHGEKSRFEYTYGSPSAPEDRKTSTLFEREQSDVSADATVLNAYVASSFVVLHIDSQYAPNTDAVMEKTGADEYMGDGIPFIFTVDRKGQYAGNVDHDLVEISRRGIFDWYRGYDRHKLLAELQRIHAAASK